MEIETLVQNYIFELDKFFKIIDRSIDIIIIDLNFDILEWTKVIQFITLYYQKIRQWLFKCL